MSVLRFNNYSFVEQKRVDIQGVSKAFQAYFEVFRRLRSKSLEGRPSIRLDFTYQNVSSSQCEKCGRRYLILNTNVILYIEIFDTKCLLL